jgi:hypothetical protein
MACSAKTSAYCASPSSSSQAAALSIDAPSLAHGLRRGAKSLFRPSGGPCYIAQYLFAMARDNYRISHSRFSVQQNRWRFCFRLPQTCFDKPVFTGCSEAQLRTAGWLHASEPAALARSFGLTLAEMRVLEHLAM